eukprot:scaffold754_cov248-Pinguiococcus_pyrenoidosus.AAC.53
MLLTSALKVKFPRLLPSQDSSRHRLTHWRTSASSRPPRGATRSGGFVSTLPPTIRALFASNLERSADRRPRGETTQSDATEGRPRSVRSSPRTSNVALTVDRGERPRKVTQRRGEASNAAER